jgi:hypothetical protein
MFTENLQQNKREHLVDYLVLEPPQILKNNALASLIVPDLLFLLFVFIDPFIPLFAYILLIPVALLNLWALWIFITPYKSQLQYFLYVGVNGVIVSVGLLISAIKVTYYTMGIQSLYYPIITIVLYVFIFLMLTRLHFSALSSDYYQRSKKQSFKPNTQSTIIVVSTSIGIIVGHILVSRYASFNSSLAVLAGLAIILSLIYIMTVHNIHKYVLICKYPELVVDRMYIRKEINS